MPGEPAVRLCIVPGCGRRHLAKGFCNAHYLRVSSRGNAVADVPVRRQEKGRRCEVDGCNRKHYGLGRCRRHYGRENRRRIREQIIQAKGGACQRCGNSYPWYVYDLHHRDPATKEFVFSAEFGNKSLAEMLLEAEKCDLLCANCHREVHHGG